MPQHVRGDAVGPVRRCARRRGGQAKSAASRYHRAAVPSALRRSEQNSGAPGRA